MSICLRWGIKDYVKGSTQVQFGGAKDLLCLLTAYKWGITYNSIGELSFQAVSAVNDCPHHLCEV